MKKAVFLILIFPALHSCDKREIDDSIPQCVKKKIEFFIPTLCAADGRVTEYLLQDRPVYVFDPGFCGPDSSAEVYDSSCNYIGSLGGFGGNTKIRGIEFSTAVFVRVIWRNEYSQ